uniref:Uncharacterized protein n=1 Tax=Oryza meridionalis TaxID=40149 RepID=A0A0E0CPQ8_9ORYZ
MPWEFTEANMKKDWNNRWSLPAARSLAAAATPLHSAGRRALARLLRPLVAARCRSPVAKRRTKKEERK